MLYNILKISLIVVVASVALVASAAKYLKVKDRHYHFSNDKLSWYVAFLECRSYGDFLASPDRPSDYDVFSKYLVKNLPKDHYLWLSGTDLHSEGNFSWFAKGSHVKYGQCAYGQPDNYDGKENCMHLKYSYNDNATYEMYDWDCSQEANYICESFYDPNDQGLPDSYPQC